MPIYEYKCTTCATSFDVIRKSDYRDDECGCPTCGVVDFHTRKVSDCHFSFVGGMPSYQDQLVASDGEVLDESGYNNVYGG